MSRGNNRSFADFIPQLNQPSLPSFRSVGLQQVSSSSLMRITEPNSATLSAGGKSQFSIQTSQTPSLTASRRNDSNNSKRLKLKDYLHLNSIEKNSKKSNSSSKNESEQSSFAQTRKNPLSMTNIPPPAPLLQSTVSQPQPSVQFLESTQILKEDIRKRIQAQISELNDLAKYVKQDFKVHENEAQSQFLLFNVLNSVVNGSKNFETVGDQIIQYEKKEGRSSSRSKDSQYFWEKKNKSLESPARILKKGLQMTFNLNQLLLGRMQLNK